MLSAVHVIERIGLPTRSWMDAALEAKKLEPSPEKALKMVRDITSDPAIELEGEHAVFTFYYIVQNAVKSHNQGSPLEGADLLTKSSEDATTLLYRLNEGDMKYVRAVAEDPIDEETGQPINKSVKGKRGAKQHLATQLYVDNKQTMSRQQLIELFMSELEMTKAGANSYYYKLSKEYGPVKQSQTTHEGRKVTKKDAAIKLYGENKGLTREQMIDLLVDRLQTTKAGANTYFIEGRKVHGDCKESNTNISRPKSKKAKAATLYANNPGLSKEQYIVMFERELDTSRAGASTYFYNVCKKPTKS